MSSIKKVNISRKKADITPSKSGYLGSKNINFHHQATLDDTTIDLTSLNGWIVGVSNPNPSEMANVGSFSSNFILKSSTREYELVKGYDYTLLGTLITFMNGYEALEDEQFTGSVLLPTSNAVVSDSKVVKRAFDLPIGDVLLSIGDTYEVNTNPTQQVGSIMVYRNGKLQLRCVGNVLTGEGNYIEIDSGNGYGNQIQFKVANGSFIDGVVVEFGVYSAGDLNLISDMERLAGSVYQLSEDMADVTGNPVEDYFTASASEIDRLSLSTTVTAMLNIEIPILTEWAAYNPSDTAGFGTITNNTLEWRQNGGNLEIRGGFASGTVTASTARLELPNSFIIKGSNRSYGGEIIRNATALPYRLMAVGGRTYFTIGGGGSQHGDVAGNSFVGSSEQLYLTATIPIQGWVATKKISDLI